jgi:hypothetical protein
MILLYIKYQAANGTSLIRDSYRAIIVYLIIASCREAAISPHYTGFPWLTGRI